MLVKLQIPDHTMNRLKSATGESDNTRAILKAVEDQVQCRGILRDFFNRVSAAPHMTEVENICKLFKPYL